MKLTIKGARNLTQRNRGKQKVTYPLVNGFRDKTVRQKTRPGESDAK